MPFQCNKQINSYSFTNATNLYLVIYSKNNPSDKVWKIDVLDASTMFTRALGELTTEAEPTEEVALFVLKFFLDSASKSTHFQPDSPLRN